MQEKRRSVGMRFVRLMKGARDLGLFALGLTAYLVMMGVIIWASFRGLDVGIWDARQAVIVAASATAGLHWMLQGFSM